MKRISFLIFTMFLFVLSSCVDNTTGNDNYYNVYFLGIEGNIVESQVIKSDDDIRFPMPPVEEGYHFVEWLKESVLDNGDVIYKSNYQVLTYEVKFYNNNGGVILTETVNYNESATAPTATEIDGFDFVGWDKTFTNVKSNLEVHPIYVANKFTVTFYDENNNVISTQEVNKGQSATAPLVPSKEDYVFVEWDQDFTNVNSNLDVRPIYNLSVCNVTFYDAENNVISVQKVNVGEDAIAPTTPTQTGHTFTGWDKEYTSVQTNLEIYPVFEINKFTVKFYDANNNVISTEEVAYGSDATAPANPEKTGYTFTGWDQTYTNVQASLDVKPIFTINQYTVKFYDAEGVVLSEQVINYGENATAPASPSKQGSTFMGWDKTYTNVTSNLDVYPVYDDIYYEVSFVDMFGSVIDTQSVKAYESAVAPTAPTVDYYTFSKWDKNFSSVTSNLTVTAVYTKNNTTYSMSTADYWLQILADEYNINKTILTSTQIDYFNQQVLSDYSKTKVVDFNNIAKTTTSTNVTSMINNYSNMNSYTVYNGVTSTGTALSTSEKTTILNNRNLSAIPTTVTVEFGLIVDFAWVRSYPTNYYSSSLTMDRFQETSLNVGEGVAIYHESLDGEWYFVQAQNYNGWVEKKYIATCKYDVMINFLNAIDKLVVISDYVTIENAYVRMGQAFPLTSTTSTNYNITFPTRNTDGTLNLKAVSLSKTADYNVGYLDYTYKNLYTQAFKLLGIEYSWGDKYKTGRDCSSTMNSFYTCFGFKMPRNTSSQRSTPTYGESVSSFTTTKMQNYHPGTLIYSSGHVMMYIGEDASGNPYLLHNTNASNKGCITQTLSSYGPSNIIGILKMQ